MSPRRVYIRKLKGTFEFDLKNRCLFCWKSEFVFKKLNWKIEVCFKMGVWIEEFAFENGSLKMGVCFGKWKFVFENRSLKVEVCFRKLELKIRICFRKSGFDVGAWASVPDCAEGSMFRHWRNRRSMLKQRRQENNLSEPIPKPGQRSPRNALQKKKEKKENRTRNHLSTFNQKYESQDHKRN